MKKVRRYVAQARRSNDSRRMANAAALPLAGFIAIMSAQIALLSANGDITMSALAPVVWQAICFTGLIAVIAAWYQR